MKSLLKGKVSSVLLTVLTMFFWGSLFPVIKCGYQAFSVDTSYIPSILLFAGIRFVLCGAVMLGFAANKMKKWILPDKKSLPPILLVALFGYILHYAFQYVGVSHLDGSKTAILKQTGSLFIVCFAFLFRKEDHFSVYKLLGGLMGFFSILIVSLDHFSFSVSPYDLLILAASFASVASTIFSKNAYDTLDPIYVTAWAQFLGGAVLTILGAGMGGTIGPIRPASVGVMAYMIFASCAGYGLWNSLLKYNDISKMNTIKFSEMLFSAICSWILLGENIFRLEYIFSFLLVCGGIVISSGLIRHKTKQCCKEGM